MKDKKIGSEKSSQFINPCRAIIHHSNHAQFARNRSVYPNRTVVHAPQPALELSCRCRMKSGNSPLDQLGLRESVRAWSRRTRLGVRSCRRGSERRSTGDRVGMSRSKLE